MADQEFTEAVMSAMTEASSSREQLGRSYALEFEQSPDQFDPRKLIALGREGLVAFATATTVPTRELELQESHVEARDSNEVDGGWARQPLVPLPFEISAILFGSIGGIGVIVVAALVLTH